MSFPAKFGSLPYLLAANSYLKDGIAVDSTLKEFCTNMFGKASISIYKILQMWGNENTAPSKHKMQLYVQLLNRAVQQIQDDSEVIKSRIIELKAYMHYMVMYFDLANNDNNKAVTKADKDAAICMYLAKANKMQLVNSYYLINTIVSKYATTSDFYVRYNVTNGTAYNNGNLALLTTAEIENNFLQDVANYSSLINDFVFEEEDFVQSQFESQSIAPLQKINTRLYYTNGANYYNKTAFNLIAPHAGSFTIQYKPAFEMKDKGYVNFVIENADVALQIIKDVTINNTNGAGTFKVDLPKAGKYLLTIVSKYKTILDLSIITNGNYFYKKGPF
ncbi:MAG: hypothetical protein IPP48_05135 [Chitinophagaceae bacterium]|nr:hypothetical protein [Chitinophagaceae bacterium]